MAKNKLKINKTALNNINKAINEYLNEKITFSQFVDKYNNFYHYHALDGHEGEFEKKNDQIIKLHRKIQDIIDSVYWDDVSKLPESRIKPDIADERLRETLTAYEKIVRDEIK
jgi:hypothetical protein